MMVRAALVSSSVSRLVLVVAIVATLGSSGFVYVTEAVSFSQGPPRTVHATSRSFPRLARFEKHRDDVALVAGKRKTKAPPRSKKKKTTTTTTPREYETDLVPHDDDDDDASAPPSLEEIIASLGPFQRAIARGVELGIVTGSSYVSGGLLGYGVGGVWNLGRLARRAAEDDGVRRTVAEEARRRAGEWHKAAAASAGRWAELSAAFSGFHAAARVVRGGREDRWNGVLGSAATGAYLNRAAGPRGAASSAVSYAAFAYALDAFVGVGSGGNAKTKATRNNNGPDKDFGYTETPVVD